MFNKNKSINGLIVLDGRGDLSRNYIFNYYLELSPFLTKLKG